jgi:adenosylhomocysteinase
LADYKTQLFAASYSGSSDSDDEHCPREREQRTSNNFTDFCIRNVRQHQYGRREITLAEKAMPGLCVYAQTLDTNTQV